MSWPGNWSRISGWSPRPVKTRSSSTGVPGPPDVHLQTLAPAREVGLDVAELPVQDGQPRRGNDAAVEDLGTLDADLAFESERPGDGLLQIAEPVEQRRLAVGVDVERDPLLLPPFDRPLDLRLQIGTGEAGVGDAQAAFGGEDGPLGRDRRRPRIRIGEPGHHVLGGHHGIEPLAALAAALRPANHAPPDRPRVDPQRRPPLVELEGAVLDQDAADLHLEPARTL